MRLARIKHLLGSIALLALASCGPVGKTQSPHPDQGNAAAKLESARVPDWFDSCVPEYMDAGRPEPERRRVIAVTSAAVAKIKSIAAGQEGWHVRVRVEAIRDKNGTPAQFKNHVELDQEVYPEIDFIDESQGVSVVVDRRSADFLSGHVLDWIEGRMGFQLQKQAK